MSPTFAQSVPSSGPTTVGSAVGVAVSGLVVETPGGDVLVPIAASSAAASASKSSPIGVSDTEAPEQPPMRILAIRTIVPMLLLRMLFMMSRRRKSVNVVGLLVIWPPPVRSVRQRGYKSNAEVTGTGHNLAVVSFWDRSYLGDFCPDDDVVIVEIGE